MRTGWPQTLVLSMAVSQCLYSGDWPQWRGPDRRVFLRKPDS